MKKVIFLVLFVSLLPSLYSQTWKQAAEDSIIKYRTSPLNIKIVDDVGDPVEGVAVHVKLLNHQFKWGTTVNINDVSRILGTRGTFNINSPYLNHFRLFNSVTPDNAGKWKGWVDQSQRTTYLKTIDWLESEGIANRGHTCVWESERFNAIPDILIGQTDTAFIRAEVKSHIKNVMSTLSDEIYEMDVVNELVHEQHIVKGLLNAADPALEHSKWYKWAKEAAPEVDLVANEFDLFQSGNNFYQRYIDYVQKMINDGAPVDRVGMQGHFWTDMPTYEELKRRIERVKPLGLPMAVTEFDMKGKAYDDMERVMYAVFSEPQIYGFTVWGAWDGSQWRKNGPLFEEDWSIKPSGHAWLDLVHGKWSNDSVAFTDAGGMVEFTAFKGEQLIGIQIGDSVLIDTVIVADEEINLTYNRSNVTSVIPTGELIIEGDNNQFSVFQPAILKLESNYPDSILKVEFFENLFMEYRDTAPDFKYELIIPSATTKTIYAKVTCKSGYMFTTDEVEITFLNNNAFPNINKSYPFTNQKYVVGSTVTVACEAVDYDGEIWKVELSGFPDDTVLVDTEAPYAFTFPAQEPGIYQLELRAVDSLYGFNTKNVSYTVVQSDEADLTPPDVPENLRISAKSENQITVNWDAPDEDNILGYFVYIDGEKYTLFGTNSTKMQLDLQGEGSHSIYVTAISEYSIESEPSNTISSDDEVTNISETDVRKTMEVYPNPFSTTARIQVDAEVSLINIYNQVGQLVRTLDKENTIGSNTIFIWDGKDALGNEVAPGVYYVKTSFRGNYGIGKVVKLD